MPDTLRGGTWNMLRDRNDTRAARTAVRIMREHRLDFLCLQECAGYLAELRDAAGEEFRLISFRGDPGRRETAILVRRSVPHGHGWQVRMTRSGWITVRGGKTPPKYLTCVLLDDWLVVASVHTAPSVRWRGGRIFGPSARVLSMVQYARRERRFISRRRHVLSAGDRNATPEARGRWTPHWIARKAGAEVVAPKHGTHGSRTIDFAIVKGAHATARRQERHGSDHRLVIFEVTR